MKKIKLTQGQFALVDDTDFEWLNQWKWQAKFDTKKNDYYATRHEGNSHPGMHNIILQTPKGLQVDHKNGKSLDNRRSNLRLATPSQNQMNSKIRKDNTSGYKGISWNKLHKKWYVSLTVNKKSKFMGLYKIKKEAIVAYRRAALLHYGEFAKF